jgi:hypothetical protein
LSVIGVDDILRNVDVEIVDVDRVAVAQQHEWIGVVVDRDSTV